MPRALKHAFAILVVLIVAGCSGGGGCSSCSGITPLPGGFDAAKRIENAGAVRVTDSGLQFMQNNLGTLAKALLGGMGQGGVLTFNVPNSSGGGFPAEYNVCPNGPNPNANPPQCVAEIDAGNAKLTITPTGPYDLSIKGTMPIRLRDLPIDFKLVGIPGSADATLTNDNSCPGDAEPYDDFPLDVDIAIHVDTDMTHSRKGYSKVEIKQLVNDNDAQGNIKNHLHFCGGIGASILNLVEPLIIGQLYSGLTGTLKTTVEQQLCQKSNPNVNPSCPTGTNDVNGICRYGADDKAECASIILGQDGHIDLGKFLATLSPGTTGGLDFLLAAGGPDPRTDDPAHAWGDLDPINNGMTLGLFGGAEPNPLSKCVKMADITLPTGIPIPMELQDNTVPNWPGNVPGPHIGIALSERYANYALANAYNSGVLCIGVSSENIPLLNSGTFGLIAPSLKNLAIQQTNQQIALVVRPSQPPSITFGNGTDVMTDPNIRIKLNQASFDFYVFSLDRFIRFMTATFDLDVPVNLAVSSMGLTPVIDKIGVNNGKVSNNDLLSEDPAKLASALGDIIKGMVGQALGGSLKPINLNSALASLGLTLQIPDTVKGQGSPGLRKLTSGTDNFLGIFAAFGLAGNPVVQSKTVARLVDKRVVKEGLVLPTMTADNAPVVRLALGSSLPSERVEFTYKVDAGVWHSWSDARTVDVTDGWLRLEGRHTIAVVSRIVGVPGSEDPSPAVVDVIIDGSAPALKIVKREDGKVDIVAKDAVSGPDATLFRVKLDDGAWSPWTSIAKAEPIDVAHVGVISAEAKDEDGHVATATEELIRGRAPADAMSGCGCSVPGTDPTSTKVPWLLGVAIAGALARFFRRRVLVPSAIVASAGAWSGCSCGDNNQQATSSTGAGGSTMSSTGTGGSTCMNCPTLQPGLIGAYTSVAIGSDNAIWVAGYSEADYDNDQSYGDLVVGKWDGTKVDWKQVDGVPSMPMPDPSKINTNGFRGGQTAEGDDVGIWTSIALDGANSPAIAYYDRSNSSLKFAQQNGSSWTAGLVEMKANADIGRYAKMIASNGGFAIAYLDIEPGGDMGAAISKVRLATTTKGKPAQADWQFEDVAVNKSTPCRATFCSGGAVCLATTKRCATPLDMGKCMPACASGNACVDNGGTPTCTKIFDSSKLDAYPDASGDYVAIAPDGQGGFGVAFYDRTNGNLVVAQKTGGAWKTTIVDGLSKKGPDVGIGASLFIDGGGDWHLSYVDGYAESLRYVRVAKGSMVSAPEVVDDGLSLGGMQFPDGQHVVGDDSSIFVTSSGEVHISYQDATSGKLHYAVGAPASMGHTWTVKVVDQMGFAGAFSHVIQTNGQLQVVNWWRTGGMNNTKGDVRILAP